ncbi:MAG: pyridoxal phosphate-dependent aminotransferase, partial [Cypionkella sp.]|uniref:aminotransferase class I/II-fold pyridoxal phosphate-dependent enzyme n=1 Tax=Cypionkella sp. TaxID=2811411 RepID=UPI0026095006
LEVWKYGDPECFDLKTAIAAHHGCTPAHVVVGEGIDALLGYLVRLTIGPRDAVVTSLGAYPTFNFHVAGFGGTLHRAPYKEVHEDTEALLALAASTRAKLIYLANPDNPMGSHHPGETISDLLANLPDQTLLVLDEAYIDLAPEGTAPEIPADTPNLIRFRTFSKAHGLAGLRVGYAITSAPLATAFDKVRNHFGLGRIAQAGALAALQDQAYLTEIRAKTATARTRLSAIARANGLIPLPSATNFITMDCTRDGNYARRVLAELLTRGIFVRMPGVAPLDRCIRVSLGDEAALAAFERALPEALKAAG